MVRSLILGVVLFGPTVVNAEPLRISRLGVAYWTATDDFEFRVEFDRPPTFPGDYFALALIADRPPTESEWTTLGDTGIGEMLHVTHHLAIYPSTVHTFKGDFPYSLEGPIWTARLPFDATGLSAIPPTFNLVLRGQGEPPTETRTFEGNPIQVDRLVMGHPVPEPSAGALIATGALVPLWICLSRARRRRALLR